MDDAEAVRDWSQLALVGAIVDLQHRLGFVREAGRVEAVHGGGSVTVRFSDAYPDLYRKTDWAMILKIGRQAP